MNDIIIDDEMKKEDSVLNRFIEEINLRLGHHLKDIILFGSRARGDYTSDSDYDCLLVVDEVSSELKDTVDDIAGDFLYNYNVVFSIFPVSETNYKEQKYNPLFMNIKNDGIAL
jgi:predicted nucleotidyltransferase